MSHLLPELTWPSQPSFNVYHPLTWHDLRGRLVILDFWTYCCINCLHVLSTLKRIEQRFGSRVAVIGIHSPKFTTEQDPVHVQEAIQRYDIQHPVLQDADHRLWRQWQVNAWPTLIFIAPDGQLLGRSAGEPDPVSLERFIQEILHGFPVPAPFDTPLAASPDQSPRRLAYPGKIKPFPCGHGNQRWVIADSGHHQIVMVNELGEEVIRFGSGQAGFRDGPMEEAEFHAPQGLIATCDAIFVADTFNHAIRHIDLQTFQVQTLAGTGERGTTLTCSTSPRDLALASVWDLAWQEGLLYFANAGTHQLGVLDLKRAEVLMLAGSGAENIQDGPAVRAALAQPSGLALSPSGSRLYFVDSETSALRFVDLAGNREVSTMVGQALFAFGHQDGPCSQALMQHPLGLTVASEKIVFVADSYNDTLRMVNMENRQVTDVLRQAAWSCLDPVCQSLSEPAGIAWDEPDQLLVSDTNHHRIVAFSLSTKRYRTWCA